LAQVFHVVGHRVWLKYFVWWVIGFGSSVSFGGSWGLAQAFRLVGHGLARVPHVVGHRVWLKCGLVQVFHVVSRGMARVPHVVGRGLASMFWLKHFCGGSWLG